MLYDEQRYVYRGKFAESRSEKNCLKEYAEVFKTVCMDVGYHRIPDHRCVEKLVVASAFGFFICFKMTDKITIKKLTNLPRFGVRAGDQLLVVEARQQLPAKNR